jgi:hypothetical protein
MSRRSRSARDVPSSCRPLDSAGTWDPRAHSDVGTHGVTAGATISLVAEGRSLPGHGLAGRVYVVFARWQRLSWVRWGGRRSVRGRHRHRLRQPICGRRPTRHSGGHRRLYRMRSSRHQPVIKAEGHAPDSDRRSTKSGDRPRVTIYVSPARSRNPAWPTARGSQWNTA